MLNKAAIYKTYIVSIMIPIRRENRRFLKPKINIITLNNTATGILNTIVCRSIVKGLINAETPRTKSKSNMLAPTTLPKAISLCCLRLEIIVVQSSGSDVPRAIIDKPITAGGTLKNSALINPLTIDRQTIVFNMPVAVLFSVMMLILGFRNLRFSRLKGIIILIIYVLYIAALF